MCVFSSYFVRILTRNTANNGNGANSSPVMAAIVPNENVVTMAKANAATGEFKTGGNSRAVIMPADIKAANANNRVCNNSCNYKENKFRHGCETVPKRRKKTREVQENMV